MFFLERSQLIYNRLTTNDTTVLYLGPGMGLDLGELELRVVGVHLLDLFSSGRAQHLKVQSQTIVSYLCVIFLMLFHKGYGAGRLLTAPDIGL